MRTMNPLNMKSERANDESEERPIATKISGLRGIKETQRAFCEGVQRGLP
jgi:hypothetical protein